MKTYTLSFWIKQNKQQLTNPPKWQFWKKPELLHVQWWERRYIELTEAEGRLIIDSAALALPIIHKLFPGMWNLQLEEGAPASQYIKADANDPQ